jgi:hypothetical protein
MGNSQKSKFLVWIGTESDAIITPVKLEIKKSTCKNFNNDTSNNLGVFACEFIPANTYICKSNPKDITEDSISRTINDLGYEGSAKDYEKNYEYAESKSNLVYVNVKDTFGLDAMVNEKKPLTFIKTLRDIESGEELSRHYGIEYWYNYEFDNKHKDFILTKNELGLEQELLPLPSDYCFIDEFRIDLGYNHCLYVFGKCVDNKYYYVKGICMDKNYYTRIEEFTKLPIFSSSSEADEDRDKNTRKEACGFKYLIDISKPDNSKYKFGEPIVIKQILKKNDIVEITNLKYYSTKYLKSKPTKYFNTREELNEYIDNTPQEEKSKYNLQVDYSKKSGVKVFNV